MSKFIILTAERANDLNYKRKGVNIFYAAEIYHGGNAGKCACSENSQKEFPELFTDNDRAVELDNAIFILTERERLTRGKAAIETRIAEIDEEERIR